LAGAGFAVDVFGDVGVFASAGFYYFAQGFFYIIFGFGGNYFF